MQFTTEAGQLLSRIKEAEKASPSNTTTPILRNLLFEKTDGGLRITGSDLEVTVSTFLPMMFGGELESVAVPTDRISGILKSLPKTSDVRFEAKEENGGVQIYLDTGKGQYEIAGQDGDDFPVPDETDAERFEVDGEALASAIERTVFCCAESDRRRSMMGVYFDQRKNCIVGTDGHRLSRVEMNLPEGEGFIVPADAAELIASLAGETVSLRVTDSVVEASGSDWTVTARLLDEEYPQYNAVIPDPGSNVLTAEASEIESVAKRVGLFASDVTNQVRFSLNGEVKMSGRDVERNAKSQELVNAQYDGVEMEIGFNAENLRSLVKSVSGSVRVSMSDEKTAVLVTPTERDDHAMVLVPVCLMP